MRAEYLFDPAKPEILPDLIKPLLSLHGIAPEEVLAAIRTDLDENGSASECYLIASKEKLVRLCGVTGARNDRKSRFSAGHNYRTFTESSFCAWDLAALSDFTTEELISSCRICARSAQGGVVIARLSMGYREDAKIFCTYLSQILSDGAVTPLPPEKARRRERFCPKCGMRYADEERKICPHCRKRSGTILRTAKVFRNFKRKLFWLILALVVTGGLSILSPYFSARFFYDEVLDAAGAYYGRILLVIGIIAGTRILSLLAGALHSGLSSFIAADMVYDLRKTIFSSINRLSVDFFTSHKTGGLMTQVNSDSNTIYWFFCETIPYFAVNIVQILAASVVMLLLSPPLFLAALLLLPPTVIFARMAYKKLHVLHERRFDRSRSVNGALSDMLGGARVVKAFSGEILEKQRFSRKSEDLANADLTTATYSAKVFPPVRMLLESGNILVWAVGGAMILARVVNPALIGEQTVLTYGTLAAFLSYVSMVFSPVLSLVDMVSSSADSVNAMERLLEIMDAKPDVQESPDPVTPEAMKGGVSFENVSFSYLPGRPVLQDISFSLQPGRTLGIVGKTGAGKTTLVNLLMRLYDPDEGTVRIDGIDVKDLSFAFLRKHVAAVSQDTYLFSGSILENVRYARPEATLDEVVNACVAAGAHEFIMKLRDGYETKIGQGNEDLSGGERQRLSIARAILKDPKILILDEATAAMDTRTEQSIQRSIGELSRGRTTLIIAHRLSTLRDADELIVIDDKKLAEHGTPDELIRKKGVYFRLYQLQMEALKTIGISEQ